MKNFGGESRYLSLKISVERPFSVLAMLTVSYTFNLMMQCFYIILWGNWHEQAH